MTLSRTKVIEALESRRDDFLTLDQAFARELDGLRRGARVMRGLTAQALRDALGGLDHAEGAFPTDEWDTTPDGAWWRPFTANAGDTHESWRAWAMRTLTGVTTCAVDGSQIYPSSEWSIDVGAVQIGRFVNGHAKDAYSKDLHFEAIPATDLYGADNQESHPRELVDLRRFQAECAALTEWIEDSDAETERVAIFDGSLIASFVRNPDLRQRYVAAVVRLLVASESHAVPVVGYIDASRARDLGVMVAAVRHTDPPRRVTDGVWLPPAPWGARTPAFISARGTGLEGYGEHARSVAFLYLRASSRRRPARLEFPRWVVEAGRTEWMTDVVRAEVVAQADGYPYAAETADALAVLTQADRDRFHALFQDFAERNGLDAHLSGKSASKRRRR
ncbi:MAG: DNA double-strand break repair nuclease NurA [Chloroflexi bacterium]|nr:DNA double-strand break repair nuclease NurA [Chloroflexota bacterium]